MTMQTIDHFEFVIALIVLFGLIYMSCEMRKADRKRPDHWDMPADWDGSLDQHEVTEAEYEEFKKYPFGRP